MERYTTDRVAGFVQQRPCGVSGTPRVPLTGREVNPRVLAIS